LTITPCRWQNRDQRKLVVAAAQGRNAGSLRRSDSFRKLGDWRLLERGRTCTRERFTALTAQVPWRPALRRQLAYLLAEGGPVDTGSGHASARLERCLVTSLRTMLQLARPRT
jgi:hypothetical protein